MSGPENRLKNWAVPRIPPGVETYHLTLTTLLWSVGNVIAGFYAEETLNLLVYKHMIGRGYTTVIGAECVGCL